MPLQETGLVLCNKRTGASGQDRNLLLNLLDIILTGLEIDLKGVDKGQSRGPQSATPGCSGAYMFDSDNLAGMFINGLVNGAKAATCEQEMRIQSALSICRVFGVRNSDSLPNSSITW
jgi:hypothetical protein